MIGNLPRAELRMIGIDFEVGEKKSLVARLVAASVWLDGDEYTVNLCQGLGVVTLHNPALSGSVIFIENPQVDGLLSVGPSSAPSLKGSCLFHIRLLIQIVGIKNQRFSPRVEHPGKIVDFLCLR